MNDNPNSHILVKSVDEFAAMLLRRGYCLEEHKDIYGNCYKFMVNENKEQIVQYIIRESIHSCIEQ